MLELLDSRIRPGFVAAEVKFARILKDFCNKNTRYFFPFSFSVLCYLLQPYGLAIGSKLV